MNFGGTPLSDKAISVPWSKHGVSGMVIPSSGCDDICGIIWNVNHIDKGIAIPYDGYMYVHLSLFVYICMCIYIYIHVYMYIYI